MSDTPGSVSPRTKEWKFHAPKQSLSLKPTITKHHESTAVYRRKKTGNWDFKEGFRSRSSKQFGSSPSADGNNDPSSSSSSSSSSGQFLSPMEEMPARSRKRSKSWDPLASKAAASLLATIENGNFNAVTSPTPTTSSVSSGGHRVSGNQIFLPAFPNHSENSVSSSDMMDNSVMAVPDVHVRSQSLNGTSSDSLNTFRSRSAQMTSSLGNSLQVPVPNGGDLYGFSDSEYELGSGSFDCVNFEYENSSHDLYFPLPKQQQTSSSSSPTSSTSSPHSASSSHLSPRGSTPSSSRGDVSPVPILSISPHASPNTSHTNNIINNNNIINVNGTATPGLLNRSGGQMPLTGLSLNLNNLSNSNNNVYHNQGSNPNRNSGNVNPNSLHLNLAPVMDASSLQFDQLRIASPGHSPRNSYSADHSLSLPLSTSSAPIDGTNGLNLAMGMGHTQNMGYNQQGPSDLYAYSSNNLDFAPPPPLTTSAPSSSFVPSGDDFSSILADPSLYDSQQMFLTNTDGETVMFDPYQRQAQQTQNPSFSFQNVPGPSFSQDLQQQQQQQQQQMQMNQQMQNEGQVITNEPIVVPIIEITDDYLVLSPALDDAHSSSSPYHYSFSSNGSGLSPAPELNSFGSESGQVLGSSLTGDWSNSPAIVVSDASGVIYGADLSSSNNLLSSSGGFVALHNNNNNTNGLSSSDASSHQFDNPQQYANYPASSFDGANVGDGSNFASNVSDNNITSEQLQQFLFQNTHQQHQHPQQHQFNHHHQHHQQQHHQFNQQTGGLNFSSSSSSLGPGPLSRPRSSSTCGNIVVNSIQFMAPSPSPSPSPSPFNITSPPSVSSSSSSSLAVGQFQTPIITVSNPSHNLAATPSPNDLLSARRTLPRSRSVPGGLGVSFVNNQQHQQPQQQQTLHQSGFQQQFANMFGQPQQFQNFQAPFQFQQNQQQQQQQQQQQLIQQQLQHQQQQDQMQGFDLNQGFYYDQNQQMQPDLSSQMGFDPNSNNPMNSNNNLNNLVNNLVPSSNASSLFPDNSMITLRNQKR